MSGPPPFDWTRPPEVWGFQRPIGIPNVAVIDKLAEYVYSNGPEFYSMLLERQSNNPKYGFIHPGHPDHPYFIHRMRIALGKEFYDHSQYQKSYNGGYLDVDPQRSGINPAIGEPISTTVELSSISPKKEDRSIPDDVAGHSTISKPRNLADKFPDELRRRVLAVAKNSTGKNVQDARSWIFKNCRNPRHLQRALESIRQILISEYDFKRVLGILHLVSDISYYAHKKEVFWVSSELKYVVPDIVRMVYKLARGETEKRDVMKVIDIWTNKGIFEKDVISSFNIIPEVSYHKPTSIPGSSPELMPIPDEHHYPTYNDYDNVPSKRLDVENVRHNINVSTSTNFNSKISSEKSPCDELLSEDEPLGAGNSDNITQCYNYDELPASSIVAAMLKHPKRTPYTPINPKDITKFDKNIPQSMSVLKAVDDFYLGLNDALNTAKRSSDHITFEAEARLGPVFDVENIEYSDRETQENDELSQKYDDEGWEEGYLYSWRSKELFNHLRVDNKKSGVRSYGDNFLGRKSRSSISHNIRNRNIFTN